MTNKFYPLMCWLYSTPLELLLNNSFINERFGILRRLGYKTMNKEENVAAMVLPVRYKQQQLTAHAYKLCGWESVWGGGDLHKRFIFSKNFKNNWGIRTNNFGPFQLL